MRYFDSIFAHKIKYLRYSQDASVHQKEHDATSILGKNNPNERISKEHLKYVNNIQYQKSKDRRKCTGLYLT